MVGEVVEQGGFTDARRIIDDGFTAAFADGVGELGEFVGTAEEHGGVADGDAGDVGAVVGHRPGSFVGLVGWYVMAGILAQMWGLVTEW